MTFKETLVATQPVAFQTITNGFVRNTTSHAYLLIGDSNTPLYETAIWLAQSFVCEAPNPTACGECLTCGRIERGSYMDLLVIDGSKSSIKKESLEDIQAEFAKAAIESSGKRIYILHHFDMTSAQAMNSILKFLEEPTPDVIAILTTTNPSRLLPTILSRCQNIRLNGNTTSKLIDEMIERGHSPEDAHILSAHHTTVETLEEALTEPRYQSLKSIAINWFKDWKSNDSSMIYNLQNALQSNFLQREDLLVFLEICEFAFKNRLKWEQGDSITWITLQTEITSIPDMNPQKWLALILKAKGELLNYGNALMVLDSMLYRGFTN